MHNLKLDNTKINFDNTNKIQIDLSTLPKDIKIVNAILNLRLTNTTSVNNVVVNYQPVISGNSETGWNNVDKISLSNTQSLIDITNEMQDAITRKSTLINLTFDAGTTLSFDTNRANTYLNIDYISLAECQENASYHKLDLGQSGQAAINLATGKFSISTPISRTDNNPLPLSIFANYHSVINDKLPNIGLPNGWHLNVNQFLIEDKNEDGDLDFTFIDEQGTNQIIEEKYYYKDSSGKQDVNRENLSVDLDGNYTYNGNLINTELVTSTGFKLVSSIADIPGANLVDFEPEELIQVKEQVKQYSDAIEELETNIDLYKKQFCMYALSKDMLKNQIEIQESAAIFNSQQLPIQKAIEIITKKSYENDRYITKRTETSSITPGTTNKEYGTKSITENQINDLLASNFTVTENIIKGQIIASEASFINSLGFATDYSDGSIAQQEKAADINSAIYCTAITEADFNQNLRIAWEKYTEEPFNFTNLWEKFKYSILKNSEEKVALGYKDLIGVDIQLESLVYNITKYQKQLEDYKGKLKKYQHQQKLYELQVPVHYLYDENKIIYGFGKTLDNEGNETNVYRLILITDSYENTIFISYKSLNSNLIESITDSTGKTISFTYNDSNYLETIIDSRSQKTIIEYTSDQISAIIRFNQKTMFVYTEDLLSAILSPNGKGLKVTYTNNQVVSAQALSVIDKIEDGKAFYKAVFADDEQQFVNCVVNDEIIYLDYNNCQSTSITNAKNKKITYLFDKYGKATCIYENAYIGETENFNPDNFSSNVTTYSYNNDNKEIIKVSNLPYSTNYLQHTHFDEDSVVTYKEALSLGSLICGENSVPYSYPVYKDYYTMPNASGNTSLEISVPNLSELNNIDCSHKTFVLSGWAKANSAPLNQNRKFELHAEITYTDGSSDSFSQSFDSRNTDWQYCALPIILKNKSIANFKGCIDYSNNTGTINFTDLELKQGDFEKIEINNNIKIKTTGHSKWQTKYEYDDNDRLISETITNILNNNDYKTTYEYNQNGRIQKTVDSFGIVKENIYNDKGTIIKTLTYHKDEPANVFCEETPLDEKGAKTTEVNEFGEKISSYEYIDGTGIVSASIDEKGNKTAYGYAEDGTLIQTSTTIDNVENTNVYGYTLDLLTSISHNGFDIKYNYDEKGRKTAIYIADNEYLNKSYGEFEEVTNLSTGESYKQIYDNNGNVVEVLYKPNNQNDYITIQTNIYDSYGKLINKTESGKTTTYSYDKFGNTIVEINQQHNLDIKVENIVDDEHKNITSTTILTKTTGSTNRYEEYQKYQYSLDEGPERRLESITLPNKQTQSLAYDNLGRVKNLQLNALTKEFEYLKVGSRTSNLVSKLSFATNNNITDSISYKYDAKGNITETRQFNKLLARYKYDALSRIIREDNNELKTTTIFEYDAGGNITCKKVYDFTIVENLDFEEAKQPIHYTYPITGWRDKLMGYGTETIGEYDPLGNPHKYRNKTLDWSHGRQLDKFGDIATFEYNTSGIRTSKTYYINTKCQCETGKCECESCNCDEYFTTKFLLNGTKIIRQQDCCNTLEFFYGADGITGFHITSQNATYNGTSLNHDFYYKKNIQGDIIGIIDNTGTEIVKYVYDAWGNHKAFDANGEMLDISALDSYTNTGNIVQFIANKNPFRYRGYYYDFETKLYYLNSRYYDPEIGRFINADDVSVLDLTNVAINGLNLYAYCLNNPVNEVDENGYFLWWLFAAIVFGFIAGGTVSGINAYNNGLRGWDLFGAILGGAIMGGAMGGLLAFGGAVSLGLITGMAFKASLLIGAAVGIGAGWASYSAEHAIRGDWNIKDFALAGVSGLAKGVSTVAIGYIGGKLGAFDKLTLSPILKNAPILNIEILYSFAKIMMGRKLFVYPISEFLFKTLFIGGIAGGIRSVIDLIFK